MPTELCECSVEERELGVQFSGQFTDGNNDGYVLQGVHCEPGTGVSSYTNSFNPQNNLVRRCCDGPHFTDEETEAQRDAHKLVSGPKDWK